MNRTAESSIRKAIASLKAGDKKTAQAILVGVLKENVNHALAWYLLSYSLDEREKKIYAVRRALRIQPDNKAALARLEELTEPASGVEADQSSSVPLEKDDISQLSEAEEYLRTGDKAAARVILKDLLRADPECAQAWFLLGEVADTPREQRAYWQQTLKLDPEHQGARSRLSASKVEPPKPIATPVEQVYPPVSRWRSITSFGKYSLKKAVWLFATVVVGIYITILIANLGGYVDEIFKAEIAFAAGMAGRSGELAELPNEERDAKIQEMVWAMEDGLGLHDPFLLRTFRWLVYGLTLNFGEEYLVYFIGHVMQGPGGSVQSLVLERLPYTLLLVGLSNFFVFFISVFIALFLSRKYGSVLDRISAGVASISSVPSWILGIILIIILAGQLQILPFPKVIDLETMDYDRAGFYRLLLSQMIMPVMAIFLSVFFQSVYSWRTFFLIYSQEDYVEMARAKGLSHREIERQYVLKPSFPFVITSFAMMMITVWEASIALEYLFNWPGIGPLFLNAAHTFKTSLMVAIVIIFAYLLAITIFVLDLAYAVVDPRIRLGSDGNSIRSARRKRSFRQRIEGFLASIGEFFAGIRLWFEALFSLTKVPFSQRVKVLKYGFASAKSTFREIRRYPSALFGLTIILILIGISIYTVITIPYSEAVELWLPHSVEGGERIWEKNPKNAMPAWVNFFRREKLPETIQLSTKDGTVEKSYEEIGENMTEIVMPFVFEYNYDDFPDDITLFFESLFEEKLPHITLTWITPDDREIGLGSFSINESHILRFAFDEHIERKLKGVPPQVGLLADPNSEEPVPLKGTYELQVSAIVFEEDSDVDADLVLYGRVYGIAGTDNLRRDLSIALLWGTPVALAFGFVGAIGANLAAMFIAAIGVWYGGWVDNLIQRITDVNIILPTLPIAIMVYIMYSKTIWAVLGVVVILSIFGSSIKNYRAAFLQAKESAYIEGAIAYGARGRRIVLLYLIPRIIPVLLPQLVIMVPGFVFYEATLAYLGLSDPYLPTWGKVVHDAITSGAFQGYYYWLLEPIALLMITGLAFALLGFSLDRVINPRLRDI